MCLYCDKLNDIGLIKSFTRPSDKNRYLSRTRHNLHAIGTHIRNNQSNYLNPELPNYRNSVQVWAQNTTHQ